MKPSTEPSSSAGSPSAAAQAGLTLVERLEAATEGIRELDGEIKCLVLGPCGCAASCSLRYTSSLDAALTLVPPGYAWACDQCRLDTHAFVCIDDEVTESNGHEAWGETMPLALCAAALRARDAIILGEGSREAARTLGKVGADSSLGDAGKEPTPGSAAGEDALTRAGALVAAWKRGENDGGGTIAALERLADELEAALDAAYARGRAAGEWRPRFYKLPLRFEESGETYYVMDADGQAVAMMMWAKHDAADTEAATKETERLARIFAAAIPAPPAGEPDRQK